jgi:integrase
MERIYGPSADRDKWRVTIRRGIGKSSTRRSFIFALRADAAKFAAEARRQAGAKGCEVALAEYLDHLRAAGVRPSSVATTRMRLERFLDDVATVALPAITVARAGELYAAYTEGRAAATHHGALKQVKAFFEWARKRKYVVQNPFADVEAVGRKNRRKVQLRIDETTRLYAWAVEHAIERDEALAVLLGLVMGIRASEIVNIAARDIDDGGRVLWIAQSKTDAGVRALQVPPELAAPLAVRAQRGRVLPYTRWWVRDAVRRACFEVGVPVVCAHALRGSNATIALEAGAAPMVVARSLGHADGGRTARDAYALPGSGSSAHVAAVAEKLRGAAGRIDVIVPAAPQPADSTQRNPTDFN